MFIEKKKNKYDGKINKYSLYSDNNQFICGSDKKENLIIIMNDNNLLNKKIKERNEFLNYVNLYR